MFQVRVRLVADGSTEIHPYLVKPRDMTPLEFDIPSEAPATARWISTSPPSPAEPATGAGCQVSEVWLIRK